MKAAARFALLSLAAAAAAADPADGAPAPDGPAAPAPPSGEEVPARPLSDEELDRIRRLALQGGADGSLPSSDGTIRVSGTALVPADRAALLGFVSDLRDALEAKLGARGAAPEDAAAASFRTYDYRILLRALPDPADSNAPARVEIRLDPRHEGRESHFPAVVTLYNPANGLDSHLLGDRLVAGLLDLAVLSRAWDAADAAGGTGTARPVPFAPWFAAGLARSLDPATRQDDFDRVRDALSSGRLPPLPSLLAADAPAPNADPALASQLVEFWLSFPGRPRRFGELRDALAAGRPWTAELFLGTSLRKTDAAAAAERFAEWTKQRSRLVLSPGETTDSLVDRTFAAMRLVPGKGGVPEGIADGPMPLEKLLEPDAREWAPDAARHLKAEVLRGAIGRGDAYREACGLFAAFFDEAAKPRPDIGVAVPLLREARTVLAGAAPEDAGD